MQVVATAGAILPVAWLFGLPWQQALALGFIVAMSSTAIGLQSLTEKGLLQTSAGQTSFAVLLFQDLAVIPILTVLPLLATLEVHAAHGEGGHGGAAAWVEALPTWGHALVVLGAVAAVVLLGRLVVGRALRLVASTGLREMFTAASLLLVVAVAAMMSEVGLSAALGTFVAGVVLANSEYRHEPSSPTWSRSRGCCWACSSWRSARPSTSPCSSSGRCGSPRSSPRSWGQVRRARPRRAARPPVARPGADPPWPWPGGRVRLRPAGVRGGQRRAAAVRHPADDGGDGLLDGHHPRAADAARKRVVLPRVGTREAVEREPDAIEERNPVLVAGYGRFGQIVGRLLSSHGLRVTLLDIDSEQIDVVRKFGFEVYYGDASRLDLLHAAGAAEAKVLVVAVDEPEKALEIVHTARKHFPNLAILARATGRTEAYELHELGVEGFYRETFDTAVRVGVDTLRLLGMPANAAMRIGQTFAALDEAFLEEMAEHRGDQAALISKARDRVRELERVMQAEHGGTAVDPDPAWDSEALRRAILGEE
ncbi:MAG: cation:proton antiporter [Myxococcota bacterium]